MKNEPDGVKAAPPKRTMKFTPKIPARKIPKPGIIKSDPSETKDDFIKKELLSRLNNTKQSHDGFGRGGRPKIERKAAPAQVAFGYGSSSLARTYGNPKDRAMGNEYQEGFLSGSDRKVEKEYVDPWDYSHSYYPADVPLRRPHSGNPEILDAVEFGESSASSAPDETAINPAAELGLLETFDEPRMLVLQFPANLPLVKRPDAAADNKAAVAKASKKGCRLGDLPAGLMGKLLVYKSGIVKMKLGDALFDVSPGANRVFAQDVAAINTKERSFCVLGELQKGAVVIPDMDSLLDSIDGMDM